MDARFVRGKAVCDNSTNILTTKFSKYRCMECLTPAMFLNSSLTIKQVLSDIFLFSDKISVEFFYEDSYPKSAYPRRSVTFLPFEEPQPVLLHFLVGLFVVLIHFLVGLFVSNVHFLVGLFVVCSKIDYFRTSSIFTYNFDNETDDHQRKNNKCCEQLC